MGRTPQEIISSDEATGYIGVDKYYQIKSLSDQLSAVFIKEAESSAPAIPAIPAAPPTTVPAGGVDATAGTPKPKSVTKKYTQKVQEKLFGLTKNANFSYELINDDGMKDIEGLEKVYQIYYESNATNAEPPKFFAKKLGAHDIKITQMLKIGNLIPYINGAPSDPDAEDYPGLSAHLIQSPSIGPAARETGPVEFFMNAIPQLEFSRCVPYIDLQIMTDKTRTHTGLNILRFVGIDPSNNEKGTGGEHMNYSYPVSALEEAGEGTAGGVAEVALSAISSLLGVTDDTDSGAGAKVAATAYSGMEIFTTPQTFVNYENELHSVTGGVILDKSRPFLTLKQVTVTHIPKKQGTINVIQAKVDVVLHDRSRLADVSQFIAPKVFKSTKAKLEFGWSHPDGGVGSKNVYGEFLDAMRTKLTLFLVKADYGFTQDGQVNISILLQNASTKKLGNYKVSQGFLTDYSAALQKFRDAVDLEVQDSGNGTKDVLPGTTFSLDSVTQAGTSLPTSVYKKIQSYIRNAKKEAKASGDGKVDLKAMSVAIENIITGPGTIAPEDVPYSTFAILNDKIEAFKADATNMSLDPFLKKPLTNDAEYNLVANKFTDRTKYVSFGKLVLSTIGLPIAASGDYDETQVFFHSFNHCAGAMWGMNIASFPVDIEALSGLLKKKYQKSRSVTVANLMASIVPIVQDIEALPFGISRKIPEPPSSPPVQPTPSEPDDVQDVTSIVSDWLGKRMSSIGCPVQAFKPPDVSFIMETVPSVADSGKTIMKVHVYDSRSSPYNTEMITLQGLSQDHTVITDTPTDGTTTDPHGQLNRAEGADDPAELAEKLDSGTKVVARAGEPTVRIVKSKASWKTTYEVLKSRMPVILYGGSVSAINSLDVRGTTSGPVADALIIEAHLQVANPDGAIEGGQGTGPLPPAEVQLVPAVVTFNSMGCPLLSYAQQFMIEMNTGTTLEQVYGITQLSHTIGPGIFKSTATLYPTNSGKLRSTKNMLSQIKGIMDDEEEDATAATP